MPDKTRGEAPACFFVVREGAVLSPDDLRDWLRARLSDYKMPRHLEAVKVLPKGPTGKVQRRALKAYLDGLGK